MLIIARISFGSKRSIMVSMLFWIKQMSGKLTHLRIVNPETEDSPAGWAKCTQQHHPVARYPS